MLLKILLICGIVLYCQAKCDKNCEIPLTHYYEIGCKPVYTKSDDCCPAYFDCKTFQGRNSNKCYHNDQVYNDGDRLDSELTSQNCLAGCFCKENRGFICAHIDCPEFFGHNPQQPGCYRAYNHESCCSIGNKCPPFENLAVCEVNGKTYHENQRFEAPGNTNLNCICKKDFVGKYEEPFCKPVKCGIELVNSQKIQGNCAPVYYGKNGICPIQWQCNENVEAIQIAKENKGIDKTCKFNDKELNVGDKVLLKKPYTYSPEINCECVVPPIVTCIQKPHEQ